jgi:protein SCO1/2
MSAAKNTTRCMAVCLMWLAFVACDEDGRDTTPPANIFGGAPIAEPLAKPAFALATTDGSVFDFRRDTNGKLTLLLFGYTNCPDVCPVHMANLAAVMQSMSAAERERVRVVFVTVDPVRDSSAIIRRWLDQFAVDFVGLRGTEDEVGRIQVALNLPPSTVTVDPVSKQTDVGHATQVLAFTPDNVAHVVYPFGTRQTTWAQDLPRLLTYRASTPVVVHMDTIIAGTLRVTDGVITSAIEGREHAAYVTIDHRGSADDVLLAIGVADLPAGSLHQTTTDAEHRQHMTSLDSLMVPAGARTTLSAGVLHGMLSSHERLRHVGRTVPLQLTFRRTGVVTVPARVTPAGVVPAEHAEHAYSH